MNLKKLFKKYTTNKNVNEWYEDDDLSPSEKALIAKAEQDLKKKGIKVKDFDPEKFVGAKDDKEHDEQDDVKQPQLKQHSSQHEQRPDQTQTPDKQTIEMKAKGDKVAQARKFLQDNPQATRKQFVDFVSKFGVSPAYANTMFYALKKKLTEVFVIVNDQGKYLSEGDIWTSVDDSSIRLLVFKNEWKARKKSLQVEGTVQKHTYR